MVYFVLVLKSWGLWLTLLVSLAAVSLSYFWLNRSKGKGNGSKWARRVYQFTWQEACITAGVVLIVAVITAAICIHAGSDLVDSCYLNDQVIKAEYYEPWDEQVTYIETTSDSKGHTTTRVKTRIDYHPPCWKAVTSQLGSFDLTEAEYYNYRTFWGRELHVPLRRTVYSSRYRGDKFVCNFPGDPDRVVPFSKSESYINYVKASKYTVEKREGAAGQVASYAYLTNAGFGSIKQTRILGDTKLPDVWKKEVDRVLSIYASNIGPIKQCNPLIYIAGTSDPGFIETLKTQWMGGKKNDVILVIGCKQWPKIDWTDVIAWTRNETFKASLKHQIMALETLEDGHQLVKLFSAEVASGYQRQSMAEFEYLLDDVEYPLWVNLTIFLTTLATAAGMVIFSYYNEL